MANKEKIVDILWAWAVANLETGEWRSHLGRYGLTKAESKMQRIRGKGMTFSGVTYERFLNLIAANGKCIEWRGSKSPNGYGAIAAGFGRRPMYVHRFSYLMFNGKIQKGLVIDHICRNRWCVHPSHLRTVTPQENSRIGESPMAKNARKTACPKGHSYDERNTYWWKGNRQCRICKRETYLRFLRKRGSVSSMKITEVIGPGVA